MSMADCDDAPLLSSLEQQLKLLRRELKTKDDKIARLTEHAVMMGSHMDRLKAEVGRRRLHCTVSFCCTCNLMLTSFTMYGTGGALDSPAEGDQHGTRGQSQFKHQ